MHQSGTTVEHPATSRPGPPVGVPGYRVLSLLEPARPRRVALSPRAAHLVVATVCVGAFMGQLDASIVSVALPRLSSGLHVGLGAAEWVSLAYVLVLVALVAPIGAIADAVGRKSLYLGGFAVFTVASAGCALAPDLATLCACRVVQAVGAALLQANSVALIAATAPPKRLGRAVGVQAAAQAVGLAAGPAVGGLLLAVASWRWLFLVNVPAGAIGLVTGALLLPRSRDLAPMRRVDPRGLAIFIPAVGLALLALSLAAGHGVALVSAVPVGLVALALAAVLVRHQRRTSAPLIDPALARSRPVRRGLLAGFSSYATLFGTLVALPLFLETAHLAGAGRIGLELTALPAGIGVISPFAGHWADRHPDRVARIGLTVSGLGLLGLAVTRPAGLGLVVLLAVVGLGLGAFTPANNRSVILAAPRESSGAVSGLLNMCRGLGTAMGTAIAVVVFNVVAGSAASRAGAGLTACLLVLAALVAAALLAGAGRSRGPSYSGSIEARSSRD